jgi:phenylacetate-CoA ligase
MPFIRYVIGDLASWKPDAPCACGRTLPRLEAIDGRSADIFRTKHGTVIHGAYFVDLFSEAHGVDRFQVRQTSLEKLVILIKPGTDYSPDTPRELIQRLESDTNSAFLVEIRLVDEIPLTAGGKYRLAVSEVQVE